MPNSTRHTRKKEQKVSPLAQKVSDWQSLLDPNQKIASIKKLETAIAALSPEEHDIIEDIDDIPSSIDAYREAEEKEDKESAWKDLLAAVEDLEVLEEEEEEAPVLPSKLPPRHDRYIRCPLCARMARLSVVAEGPFESWARDQSYGGRAIIVWGPREPLNKVEQTVVKSRAQEIAKGERSW